MDKSYSEYPAELRSFEKEVEFLTGKPFHTPQTNLQIRPFQGHALIYMDPPETQSNGIHIPETSQQRSQTGQVRKLGIWKQNKLGNLIAYEVKPGDKVVVNARSGRWLHGERERLKIVPVEKILAVFD